MSTWRPAAAAGSRPDGGGGRKDGAAAASPKAGAVVELEGLRSLGNSMMASVAGARRAATAPAGPRPAGNAASSVEASGGGEPPVRLPQVLRPDHGRSPRASPKAAARRADAEGSAASDGSAGSDVEGVPPAGDAVSDEASSPTSSAFNVSEEEAIDCLRAGFGNNSAIDRHVHACPVFKDCSYDFVEELLMSMKKQLWRAGHTLVEQGATAPSSMFFVFWGCLVLSRDGERYQENHEGDFVGEAQLLGIFPTWPCAVTTKTACMVVELTRAAFMEVLQSHPQEADHFKVIADKCADLRRTDWAPLRRIASMRHCSEAFLRELADACDQRVFLPGQRLFSESSAPLRSLLVLDCGSVGVEIAGRSVRQAEVPSIRVRLTYGEELGDLVAKRRSVHISASEMAADLETLDVRRVSANRRNFASGEGDTVSDEAPGNPSNYSNRPATSGAAEGDAAVRVFEAEVPEAAVFGEELLFGLGDSAKVTVIARRVCCVRVLHRSSLMKALERHESDRLLVEPFMKLRREEIFPPLDMESLPSFAGCRCSDAFFRFLAANVEERIIAPPDRLAPDNFRRFIHPPRPRVEENVSICRLNRGRARLTFSDRSEPDRSYESGDLIPGSIFWRDGAYVVATEVCYVSILHRGIVARALEEFPLDRDVYLPLLDPETRSQNISSVNRKSRREKFAKILRDRSIFARTSQEFLNEITVNGAIRVFMPGDKIIEQGTDGTSMFLLWVGTTSVVTEHLDDAGRHSTRTLTNMGSLTHGSVFGELVMLGVQPKRTASIVACSVCCTWEVQQHQILSILDRHPIERQNFLKLVEEFLGKLAAPRLINHPLFSGFHQQFRTLIGVNCEHRLYFPGETIVTEGSTGASLYILNLGVASVLMQKQPVMKAQGGSHFGFPSIFFTNQRAGEYKQPTDVMAETMCQVLVVSRTSYMDALGTYPDMREVARRIEDDERARLQRQREGFQRMAHRRRKLRCIIEALKGLTSGGANPQAVAMVTTVFQGWHRMAAKAVEEPSHASAAAWGVLLLDRGRFRVAVHVTLPVVGARAAAICEGQPPTPAHLRQLRQRDICRRGAEGR